MTTAVAGLGLKLSDRLHDFADRQEALYYLLYHRRSLVGYERELLDTLREAAQTLKALGR